MTIKEIAQKAGVSIGTVDRVLHKRGRVAEETQKKILQIVKESDYSTNFFASNLANSRKKFKFEILMPQLDQDSSYWRLIERGISSVYDELKRYNVELEIRCFDRFSGDDFKQVYDKANKSDADALFIAPVISKVAKECFEENPLTKPYAFFDSNLSGFNPLFFIGQDSFQGGLLGGKLLHLLIGESGNVVVTRMLPEGYHINDRVAGFSKYFEEFPDIKVHEFDVDYHEKEKNIEKVCEQMIDECQDLKGVFVTNANTHCFAKILEKARGFGVIKVVGFDLVDANKYCLKNGSVNFVISQNPDLQAEKGLTLLYRSLVLKQKCKKEYMLPLDVITKENIP
jgi:LacI family transcriptional regulator, galactose operon repressor